MKNIVLFVVFILALVFVQFVNAQSVDEIINQYLIARGGKEKLSSIKSVYFEGTRLMKDGNEVQVKVTKVDGKLSRTDFEVAGSSGYSIITLEKGWFYFPIRSDKPVEIQPGMLKSMQEQLDIAGALVNYSDKGYQAALKGKDTADGKEVYKIELTHTGGKVITCYIDTTTHLLIETRQVAESSPRNGGGAPKEIIIHFSDYKDVSGVMFPQTIVTEGTGMGDGKMIFDKLDVNIPVDEKLFKPSN